MYRFGEKVARFKCAHDDKTNPLKSRQYFRQQQLTGADRRVKKKGHLLLKRVCESEWPFVGSSREERTPCASCMWLGSTRCDCDWKRENT